MQGHVDASRILGGVPTRHIRYDSLKPAVSQLCFGRSRVESQRVVFRSKGGVEHEGGRFRRSHLVPVRGRHAIAVASNRPFTEWDETFTDKRLCQAIVDRLTFEAHIIETGTPSFRLASTTAKHKAAAA
ncbi:ATP-binding protein [Streptomyces sp. NPDC051217]|uniref:ATP-binding protein n=1 Tax=Streptomyces sp. NPDC051217 TaxID=3365644 RepID=UPI0037921E85